MVASGKRPGSFTGLDRFGRVVNQRWRKSATVLERLEYGGIRLVLAGKRTAT